MPLPTSTIVFALVTCVPFGLAIRDTVTGKYQVPEIVLDEDLDRDSYEDEDEDEGRPGTGVPPRTVLARR